MYGAMPRMTLADHPRVELDDNRVRRSLQLGADDVEDARLAVTPGTMNPYGQAVPLWQREQHVRDALGKWGPVSTGPVGRQ
jgi:hypothetical protein